MLFFFAPLFWMLAIPTIFIVVLMIRALFWLGSLSRRDTRRSVKRDQPFIEGQFVDEDDPERQDDHSSQ